MKYIGKYQEFCFADGDSIKNHFNREPYSAKEKIINYLRNGGTVFCCAPSIIKDCITGGRILEEQVTRFDGSYKWPSYLAYYVDRYNLKLPNDFEKHILSLVD